MVRSSVYFMSAVLLCVFAIGLGDDLTTTKPVTVTVPPSHPNPTTTTTEPSTPPQPTTTPPSTTTPPPTTTPTTTTSTTTTQAPPTPPPTPAPTPAPAPGPLPPPEEGSWSYSQDNVTCILLQFAGQLNVTYTMNDGNKTRLAHALLNIPANASVVDGNCQGDLQHIQLSWPVLTRENNVTLQWARNATTKTYRLAYFNVTLTPDQHFPNASSKSPLALYHSLASEWEVPVVASYRCAQRLSLPLSAAAAAAGDVAVSHAQAQAFRTAAGKGFSAPHDCPGGEVPDAVPVAVGCALGALVLLVLAAYLVGRRRSLAHGYLSM